VLVDDADGTIARPPGVRLDLGGSAKGFIADRAAALLGDPCAVDCGGDVRVRGTHGVSVANPFGGGPVASITLCDGAAATSGIDARLWGRTAHHLLDPATGAPAWTGVVSATAIAPTAVEAEALAKAALLAGRPPLGPPRLPHGGVLVFDDGSAGFVDRSDEASDGATEPGPGPGFVDRSRGSRDPGVKPGLGTLA
jgi:thiamine biosynthesis lipoprotein